MFTARYIKSLIMAAAAVAAACTADPVDTGGPEPVEEAAPASLTIDFSIAGLGVDVSPRAAGTAARTFTRADSYASPALPERIAKYLDPDYSGPAPTTDEEEIAAYNEAKSINGSVMTCLTVILVHKMSNRIVAVRRIPDPDCPNSPGQAQPRDAILDDGTRACITFDYENPTHVVTREMVDELVNNAPEAEKEAVRAANEPYIGQSAERLVRGEYLIMAIANYDHNVTTSPADGGQKTQNLDKTLNGIAELFHQPKHTAEGIYPVAPVTGETTNYKYFYDLRFLMNRTLQSDGAGGFNVVDLPILDGQGRPIKPYIRPAVQQTLSATRALYLETGDNHVDLELLRISSRTRVEVKNYGTAPLKVKSIAFSPNYTQSSTYLFRRSADDRDYRELAKAHDGKGAPMVTYTGITDPDGGDPTYGAIVPFVNNMDLDNDGEADCVGVAAGEKRCIFDALMYESHLDYKDDDTDPDSFTYTIDVSYPAITNYRTTNFGNIDKDAAYETIRNCVYALEGQTTQYLTGFYDEKNLLDLVSRYKPENGYYFLVQGLKTGRCLRDDNGAPRAHYLPAEGLNSADIMSYLWEVRINGDGSCELINAKSGRYMPSAPAGGQITSAMSASSVRHTPVVTASASTVSFATSHTFWGTYYLNVWNDGEMLGGYNGNDGNSQFLLYPVKSTSLYVGTPRTIKTVTLTAFNDETAFVEMVREIQRNDFVRILVGVSYNPDNSDFKFEVESWKERSGTVDYH